MSPSTSNDFKAEYGLNSAFDTHHNSGAGKVLMLSEGQAVCRGVGEKRGDELHLNDTKGLRVYT